MKSLAVALMFLAVPVFGQHEHHPPAPPATPPPATDQHEHKPPAEQPEQHSMSQHEHSMPMMQHEMDPTGDFLMRQASGTSMNPAAAPHSMLMTDYAGWSLMLHANAFVNQVWQSGPRGGDKLFSTNWVMGMADRKLGGGHLMLRSMLSLEPATITNKRYPELFQTGETADGLPLRDAQHPHDFFMELAAEYAYPIAPDTIGYIYFAPMGDPSLGPVAYPHRSSAMELPQATLAHHTEDSTHIAANVLTIGAKRGIFGAAVSGFHGQEPDEKRWDIETGGIDSWAVRLTADPTPNITAQISTGHLKNPEALEPGDVQRTTASVAYSAPTTLGMWSSSLIYGRNDSDHGDTNAFTAETLLQFAQKNWFTARGEIVDKNELTDDHTIYRVKALTLGYTRDVWSNANVIAGVGGNVTVYDVPSALTPAYGNSPRSFYLYVRFRNAGMSHSM